MSKEELSMKVCGTPFDQAPVEWQRMVEDMIKRGVTFGCKDEEKPMPKWRHKEIGVKQ